MEAKIMVPGLYENYKTNRALFKFLSQHPDYMRPNFTIGAVYGDFQFCTWDGGRIFPEYRHTTLEEIQQVTQFYNQEMKIPMRFIFTSTLIKPEDCYDRFNNLVLTQCHDPLNEVVVNSPILEQYIRENYPKYKIISSTTKCLSKREDAHNEISRDDYYLVCLDYNLNHCKDFLESIDMEERKRCEFLSNAICPPACPNRKHHYDLNSQCHMSYGKKYTMPFCGISGMNLNIDTQAVQSHITPEEIESYYLPNGFFNFKLEGRSFYPPVHLGNCVKYLVKPEYQLFTMATILS